MVYYPELMYVYIMANYTNSVLYTGVTDNLKRRVSEHKSHKSNFTSRYNVTKLMYYEVIRGPRVAIAREKQIKAGSRKKKADLVNAMNPGWRELSAEQINTIESV
jgi:putative endonuclease